MRMSKTIYHTAALLAAMTAPAVHAAIVETGDVTINSGLNTKRVGDTGAGALTINAGSSVVDRKLLIFGANAGSNGVGLVTGAGSSLEINNDLSIGGGGTGKLTVSDGATAFTKRLPGDPEDVGEVAIGQAAGSVGELIVTGAGSSFSADSIWFYMGGSGTATLTVEDNATMVAFDQTIDAPFFRTTQNADGQATINVRSGGLLDITGAGNDVIHLGEKGDATLNIESGGRMLAGRMRVAQQDNSTVDINITGVGSELKAEFLFAAQDPNTVVTIDVEDQGLLHVTRWLYVGQEGTGTLNVSGGSEVDVDEDLWVGGELGAFAGNGSMTVTEGSTVTVDDDMYISTGIATGVFSISGDGTKLTVNDRLWVGWGYYDAASGTRFPADGTLEVGRGALIEAPGNGPSSNSGLRFTVASVDTATMRFIIGDDGAGSIESGLIETGHLRFGGGTALLDIDIDSGVVLSLGDMFTLIDYANWDGGLFDNVADDAIVSFGGYRFLIDYDTDLGGGDLALTATVVPEPTSLALLGLGGLLVLVRRGQRAGGENDAGPQRCRVRRPSDRKDQWIRI